MPRIAVIGGGAAGCFCAVGLRRYCPGSSVTVFESGRVPMSKLAITGGGRCNYTNTFGSIGDLREAYPRGANLMKRCLRVFGVEDTLEWFRREGVLPEVQDDNCIFPRSNDAMQVVGTLSRLMRGLGVSLRCASRISAVVPLPDGRFEIRLGASSPDSTGPGGPAPAGVFDAVVVTTGGGAVRMLPRDIVIEKPVPSLFTFKAPSVPRELAGITVPSVRLSLAGTSFRSEGILLLTDWGVSGPAVLRLSSYAARHLADCGYGGELLIDWRPSVLEDGGLSLEDRLGTMLSSGGQKFLCNVHPSGIPSRLWAFLLSRCGFREDIRCSELGLKGSRRLCALLSCDEYTLAGRAAFKEEFVTCGGVSLSEVDMKTLQSRRYPGLFFAGEVLDVDAVTGGFNLQAAWSTAEVAARGVAQGFAAL